MTKISVIVPVYKVEKYIGECINSILAQTFKDFELILVDDGSPDKSGEICDSYAKKDNRIKVFHKKNGGVSSARNFGIDKAVGKWLSFIDSDDTIDLNYLTSLYQGIECDKDVDLSMVGYRNVDEKLNVLSICRFDNDVISTDLPMLLSLAEEKNIINSPVCKLFRRNIIINKNISYDTSISYGEDHLFVLEYVRYIKSICLSNKVVYNYFHRSNGSLTNTACNPDKMITYVEKVKNAYESLSDMFKSIDYNKMYNHQLHDHLIRATYNLMTSNTDNKSMLFNKVYSISKHIQTNKSTSPFYMVMWMGLHLPKKLSYFFLKFISMSKHIIISLK